jgi:hypothetical protein
MESFSLTVKHGYSSQEFNNCDIETAIGIMQTKLWEYGVMDELTDDIFWDYVMHRYSKVPKNILRPLAQICIVRTTAIKV